LALVKALRALPTQGESALRRQIAARLQRVHRRDSFGVDKEAWTGWFVKAYPDLAPRLGGTDGVDVHGWHERLAKLDWSAGDDGAAGRFTFGPTVGHVIRAAQALGPDSAARRAGSPAPTCSPPSFNPVRTFPRATGPRR